MATQKRSSLPAHDPPSPVQPALPTDNDKFQFMFEHSIVGKSFTLPSGEMTVNAAFCEMLGYSRAALKHKTWQEITHPDDIGLTQSNLDRLLSGKKTSVRFNKRYLSKNGSVVWADETTCLRRDAAGRLLYFMAELVDITARRQAEEDLRLAEANYRTLVEQIPAITYIDKVESNGLSSFVSPQVEAYLGVSREEWVNGDITWWAGMIHPDDRLRAVSAYQRTMDTGQPFHEEYRMQTRDGRMVWIDDHAVLLESAPGRARSLQGVMFDITQRKLAEQSLLESENKLRALFAAMKDVIIVYDSDGRYLEIAPTDQSNLYLTPDVLIGRSVHELFPKEQADLFVSKIGQALRTGQVVQFEYALQLDGAERWFSASASALSGNTVIWVAHNITLRKQAEEALRKSETRFRAVVENSNDGILFADADGRISYRSPFYKHINGYVDKERLGQIVFETIHPDDQGAFRQYWVQVVRHPDKPQKAEYRIQHKDRTWVWVDTTSVNLLTNPDIQAIVVTSHDITARKQAELRKETVYQVLAAVSGQLDMHLLGQSAMETLARLSDYPHVCLALPEENDTRWVIRGAAGRLAAGIGAGYPIHQGVIGRAFKTGKRQWVRDTLDQPGYVRDVRLADGPALRSEIAAVLRRGNRLLGVLNVESERVDAFDDEDAAMIQSLADVIALAVENAQLYHAAQQEIAERKQAQELLQESEHKFRTLFDRAIDGIVIVDLETHHFSLSNPAICQMVGYTQAEFSGLRMEDIHPPEQLPHILERFNRPDLGGPSPSENVPVRRKDGSVFSADIAARLITLQGHTYLLSVFRDITARKLAEDKIREQLDELQRWYNLTLDRETRSLELKHEVNDLLRRLNQPVRYPSAEEAQA